MVSRDISVGRPRDGFVGFLAGPFLSRGARYSSDVFCDAGGCSQQAPATCLNMEQQSAHPEALCVISQACHDGCKLRKTGDEAKQIGRGRGWPRKRHLGGQTAPGASSKKGIGTEKAGARGAGQPREQMGAHGSSARPGLNSKVRRPDLDPAERGELGELQENQAKGR